MTTAEIGAQCIAQMSIGTIDKIIACVSKARRYYNRAVSSTNIEYRKQQLLLAQNYNPGKRLKILIEEELRGIEAYEKIKADDEKNFF